MYEATVAVVLGVFFGIVTALAGRSMKPRAEHRFFTAVMVAVALLFIGFPAEAGDRFGVVSETVAAVGFLALAGLGVVLHPLWIGVAFLSHGTWDLAYVLDMVRSSKPDWTVQFCVPYDLIVAAYVVTRARRWAGARQPPGEETGTGGTVGADPGTSPDPGEAPDTGRDAPDEGPAGDAASVDQRRDRDGET